MPPADPFRSFLGPWDRPTVGLRPPSGRPPDPERPERSLAKPYFAQAIPFDALEKLV